MLNMPTTPLLLGPIFRGLNSSSTLKMIEVRRTKKSEKRQRRAGKYSVRVDEKEKKLIEKNAKNTGLTPASLMRVLATGHQPKSTIDAQNIIELVKLRGDIGRLGGLLKMWLTSRKSGKVRIGEYLNALEEDMKAIRRVINQLEKTHD